MLNEVPLQSPHCYAQKQRSSKPRYTVVENKNQFLVDYF